MDPTSRPVLGGDKAARASGRVGSGAIVLASPHADAASKAARHAAFGINPVTD